MRPALIAVLLAVPLHAAADPTPKGWPAAGRCVPTWTRGDCVQITPDDARTLQREILGYLDAAQLKQRPDYRPAKALAARPITEGSIGAFSVWAYEYVGFKGDVVLAMAVESHKNSVERGFRVTLGRTKTGWRVLHFDHYYQPDPQLDRQLD